MTEIAFGTDGIRDRVGQGMMQPDRILRLGWVVGDLLRQQGRPRVLIGKDTRISGYMFESALEAGFIAAGVEVRLLGPMPTPAIAYLTRTFSAGLGVVISASHNPHHDNGIKFFSPEGTKISDEFQAEIVRHYHEKVEMVPSARLGKAFRIDDAPGRYIEFCKSTWFSPRGLQGFKIVLDCANGATYHIAPSVFKELGAEVQVIHAEPNGLNINQACGATDTRHLQATVLKSGADLGIAFDGDGDRVVFVNRQGQLLDGDDLLYILATLSEVPPEGVVGTVMSNMGLEKALVQRGICFERTPVGDRYVWERLNEKGWHYGAEPSGHVLCLNRLSTGDGIIAALQVLSLLRVRNITLEDALAGFRKYPQYMRNVTVRDKNMIMEDKVFQGKIRDMEDALGDGRVLVRPSGTEPKIRIMAEGENGDRVKAAVESLAQWLETKF